MTLNSSLLDNTKTQLVETTEASVSETRGEECPDTTAEDLSRWEDDGGACAPERS